MPKKIIKHFLSNSKCVFARQSSPSNSTRMLGGVSFDGDGGVVDEPSSIRNGRCGSIVPVGLDLDAGYGFCKKNIDSALIIVFRSSTKNKKLTLNLFRHISYLKCLITKSEGGHKVATRVSALETSIGVEIATGCESQTVVD